VLRLHVAVRALVRDIESAPAVLVGASDPAEAGVELCCLPFLGSPQLLGLLFVRLLVENADPVGAFAPDELLLRPGFGVGIETGLRLGHEVVEGDGAHRPPPRPTSASCPGGQDGIVRRGTRYRDGRVPSYVVAARTPANTSSRD